MTTATWKNVVDHVWQLDLLTCKILCATCKYANAHTNNPSNSKLKVTTEVTLLFNGSSRILVQRKRIPWTKFVNYGPSDTARIIVLWDVAILNLQVLSSPGQVVQHKLLDITFAASFIYGANNGDETRVVVECSLHYFYGCCLPSPMDYFGWFQYCKGCFWKMGWPWYWFPWVQSFNSCIDHLKLWISPTRAASTLGVINMTMTSSTSLSLPNFFW